MVIDHTESFLKCFAELTGASYEKMKDYIVNNNPLNIINHPYTNAFERNVIDKIQHLKEFYASYEVLKNAENRDLRINSTEVAKDYFLSLLGNLKEKERILISYLDAGQKIIETAVVSEGTVNESAIYPREIAKQALFNDCMSIIIAHNHPGEALNASKEDIALTQKLIDVLAPLNIKVLDHIIVAGKTAISMMEKGLFPSHDPNNGVRRVVER